MSENLNEPQSRTEEILQNALGEEYDVTPQSRVEKLLEQVVEGGGSGSALPSPTTADNGKVLGVDGGEYKLVEQSSGDGFVEYTYSGGGRYYLRKMGNIVEVIFDSVQTSTNKYSDIKLPFPSGFEPLSNGTQIFSALTVREVTAGSNDQIKPKVTNIVRNGENTFGIADYTTGTFSTAYVYGYGAYILA